MFERNNKHMWEFSSSRAIEHLLIRINTQSKRGEVKLYALDIFSVELYLIYFPSFIYFNLQYSNLLFFQIVNSIY